MDAYNTIVMISHRNSFESFSAHMMVISFLHICNIAANLRTGFLLQFIYTVNILEIIYILLYF